MLPNTAPSLGDQAIVTPIDTSIRVQFTATDAENDPLTYSVFSIPRGGTLGAFVDNTVMYNPTGGTVGTDTFSVRAYDGKAYSTPAVVTVTRTHGARSKFLITKTPITQVSTKTSSIGVQVADAFGNPIEDDSTTVVMVTPFLNSAGSVSPTSATVNGGKATFTATATSQTNSGVALYEVTAPGLDRGIAQISFYASPQQPKDGSIKIHIPVLSGLATANGVTNKLTDSDISGVGVADSYIAAVGSAKMSNVDYSENQYTEFSFAQGLIPENATLTSVNVTTRYQSTALFSKLEISSGASFIDQPLAVSSTNSQFMNQTVDIHSIVTTVAQANTLVMRFLSKPSINGDSVMNTFDFIGVDVTYTIPTLPTATPETLTTRVDTPLSITLSGSDSSNKQLTYLIKSQPTKGTLTALVDSQLTYTPLGQTGDDSFSYSVKSDIGESVPAKVTLTLLSGQIQKIVATADRVTAIVEDPIIFTLNATDAFGNTVPLDSSLKIQPNFGKGTLADSGIVFSGGTGTITGTASSAGSYQFMASIGSVSSVPVVIVFSAKSDSSTTSDSGGGTTIVSTGGNSGGSSGGSNGGALLIAPQTEPIVVQNETIPKIETIQKIDQPKQVAVKNTVVHKVSTRVLGTHTIAVVAPKQTQAPLSANVSSASISNKEIGYLFLVAIFLMLIVWALLARAKRLE